MTGPLHGKTIIEMGGIGPAPFAAMMLAELGAEVIRIDRPDSEAGRRLPLHKDMMHRGKKSVVLDLKVPADVARLRALSAQSDAIIEGFRPGVMERLGLGPEALRAANPRLVYGRMTGWGQSGPLAHTAGHDLNYIGLTGALHAMGEGAPVPPLNLVGDYGGGSTYLVIGLLAALLEAQTTGKGQVVDAAIVDGAAHLMTFIYSMYNHGRWQDRRAANLLDGGAPYYRCYATSCGGYVAVGCIEPQFFALMTRMLGIAEGEGAAQITLGRQNDQSYWPYVTDLLAKIFASQTRDHWSRLFNGSDACVTPVVALAEAHLPAQIAARHSVIKTAEGQIRSAAAPRLSNHDPLQLRVAPLFGADTAAVLARLAQDQQSFDQAVGQ